MTALRFGADAVYLGAKQYGLRAQAQNGTSLDDLLPETYALVREAAVRVLGQRPFDVQMIVEPGKKLAVHVECGQILRENDDTHAGCCNQQNGNRIDALVQCKIHADQCNIAGADEVHSVFTLREKMDHDIYSLAE